jgi:hypothetical protein
MTDLFSELGLNLPEQKPKQSPYQNSAPTFIPYMKALAHKIANSPNGVIVRHESISELHGLRQRFYHWRHRHRNDPDYDKTIDLFHFSISPQPVNGKYQMTIKIFSIDDFEITEI